MFVVNTHYTHPALDTIFQAIPGNQPGEWFLKDLNQSATWRNQNDMLVGILGGLYVKKTGVWRVCYNVVGGHRNEAMPEALTPYQPREFVGCSVETSVIKLGKDWLDGVVIHAAH